MVRTYCRLDRNTRCLRSRQSGGTGGVQAGHLIKTADRISERALRGGLSFHLRSDTAGHVLILRKVPFAGSL